MKPAYSLQSICQECLEPHIHNDFVIRSINLDDENNLNRDFLDLKLNRIKCPFCKNEYTFETNMVIFSPSHRFAVKVNPETYRSPDLAPDSVPEYVFQEKFRFREVNFQIEAIEKCRIFLDGLDDIYIEFLKYRFFEDKDTLPFDEINMIYTSRDSEFLYFTKYDYNNNVIDKFRIPVHLYDVTNINYPTENIWHRINRTNVNQYISDKER